jgi:tetratricopeptide (TPR) repeat protein
MLTFRHLAILVVSPSKPLYDFVQEPLTQLGFNKVFPADSAKEAMALMRQHPISLVVTTWKMPAMSGLQLLQAMRQDKTYSEIPLIMVNDTDDEQLRLTAVREGAQGYLTSPWRAETFRGMVQEIMTAFVDPDQERFYQHLDAARKLHYEQDYAGAAAEYARAVEIDENPVALVAWGDMVLEVEPTQAEALFRRALAVEAENVKALYGLALALQARGALDEAEQTLTTALGHATELRRTQKHTPWLHYYLGEIRLQLKKLQSAQDSFQLATRADPDNAELQVKIGDAYASRGYYQESETYYEQALHLDPELIHVYNKIGIAYRKQGKSQVALALYHKARQIAPDDENLLYNIARAHLDLKQYDEARRSLNEALELNPRFKEARALIQLLDARTSG